MNTKLHLKPGEKGRLQVAANVAIDESTIEWKSQSPIAVLDPTKQRTPFDIIVVGSSLGMAYVEFSALDTDGNNREHLFEIYVSEQDGDADLIGSARVSRESFSFDAEREPVADTVVDQPTLDGGDSAAEPVADLAEDVAPIEEAPAPPIDQTPAAPVTQFNDPADAQNGMMAGHADDAAINETVAAENEAAADGGFNNPETDFGTSDDAATAPLSSEPEAPAASTESESGPVSEPAADGQKEEGEAETLPEIASPATDEAAKQVEDAQASQAPTDDAPASTSFDQQPVAAGEGQPATDSGLMAGFQSDAAHNAEVSEVSVGADQSLPESDAKPTL